MKKLLFAISILLLWGCSTQKNTLVSRTYHNVTARYNYLFNAKESFNESVKQLNKDYPYSYTTTLPIFLFSEKLAPSKTNEGMERAILKSGLLVKYHSITVKPKNAKQDTKEQRAFYNQREFCRYVDDAYLYIAKGNAYLQQYDKSRQAIDQIVLNYPNANSYADAVIWKAIIAGAENDMVMYADALGTANSVKGLTSRQQALLKAAWADFYIKKADFANAIPNLEAAATLEPNKMDRARYTFILAQLYLKTNKKQQAAETFRKAAKSSPSYEMAFNAQLNEARSYTSGSRAELKSLLLKMARNEKNSPYRDQIFYTIGKINQQDGNSEEALQNFRKSLYISMPGTNQKGLTFAAIGDILFEKRDFVHAQSYYDSASTNIEPTHPSFAEIRGKATQLGPLAENTRSYYRYDSLLALSELPANDLYKLIDKKIADIHAANARSMEEENLQRQALLNQNSLNTSSNQSGSWYFYNQTTLAFGANEFKMRWGQRKLEDNWRRKNKGTIEQLAEEQKQEERKHEEKLSPLSREFYLKDIPKTTTEKAKMQELKQAALVSIAEAYRSDIDDPTKAIEVLGQLNFATASKASLIRAYSTLYRSYLALNDIPNSQKYKQLIVEQFPQSELAQSVSGSASGSSLQNQTESRALTESVDLLNKGRFADCLALLSSYQKDSTLQKSPQLSLVRAMAIGGLNGKDAYRKELAQIIDTFPNSEAAKSAKEYLTSLNNETLEALSKAPNAASETPTSAAVATPFTPNSASRYMPSEGAHTAIIIISKKVSFNQLKFNLTSLNLEAMPEADLNIQQLPYDDSNIIVAITPFENKKKAMEYYYVLVEKQSLISQTGADVFAIFAISNENLNLLQKEKTLDTYASFFMESYIK